jgi:hypothetical protein
MASRIPFLIIILFSIASVSAAQKPKTPSAPSNANAQKKKTGGKDYSYLADPVGKLKTTNTYVPKHYYLKAVVDNTQVGDSPGDVIMPQTFESKRLRFLLPKDSLVYQFYRQHHDPDSMKIPVVLEIKKMEVLETKLKPGLVGGKLDIQIDVLTMDGMRSLRETSTVAGGR